MVKITAALVLPCAFAAPAIAGPCVALDYQEMKDMSADQLAKEYCKLNDVLSENMDQTMANLDTRYGPKPYPNAQDNFDQCHGQIERVERVLESKGMQRESAIKVCNTIHAEQKVKK
jgi:hypothetical protein